VYSFTKVPALKYSLKLQLKFDLNFDSISSKNGLSKSEYRGIAIAVSIVG